jgi:hypothetical protein
VRHGRQRKAGTERDQEDRSPDKEEGSATKGKKEVTDTDKIALLMGAINPGDIPIEIKAYSDAERTERDSLMPMFWTRRDWQAYAAETQQITHK